MMQDVNSILPDELANEGFDELAADVFNSYESEEQTCYC
jgi:hypothetical protein